MQQPHPLFYTYLKMCQLLFYLKMVQDDQYKMSSIEGVLFSFTFIPLFSSSNHCNSIL